MDEPCFWLHYGYFRARHGRLVGQQTEFRLEVHLALQQSRKSSQEGKSSGKHCIVCSYSAVQTVPVHSATNPIASSFISAHSLYGTNVFFLLFVMCILCCTEDRFLKDVTAHVIASPCSLFPLNMSPLERGTCICERRVFQPS